MNCIVCGKLIENKQRKYCSPHCRARHYYLAHKDHIRAYNRQWQKDNPDKKRMHNKKAMDKFIASGKMKVAMKKVFRDNRTAVYTRSSMNHYKDIILNLHGNKCDRCNGTENLQMHHDTLVWVQGKNRQNNLKLNLPHITVVCRQCWNQKTKRG